MKVVFTLLICFLFTFSAFAQTEEKTDEPQIVGVEEIFLAKDDGAGKMGDAAEDFLTTDIPIYCVVQLNSNKPATVKMNFVAVNVKGVKAETKVLSVNYKTNGKQNRVNFTGKPEGNWTAGNYRIDIFIDGKPAIGKSFEIKKSPAEIQKPTVPAENFVPPKPRPKPKVAKSTRRN